MALGGCGCLAVLVELILLFGTLGFSLAAVATIALLKNDFKGDCPLYPTIKDNLGYFNFKANDVTNCNYIIGANGVSAGLSLIAMIYVFIELAIRKRLISFMPILKTILYGILMVLVGVSAGIVAVGFQRLCSGLETLVDVFHDYDTCKEWQEDIYWDIYGYDASHFYVYLFAALIATAITAVIWLILGIISFIVLVCCTSRSLEDDDQALII